MVEIIEHFKKHRCRMPMCFFETDDFEKLQEHHREIHTNYGRDLNG